MGCSHSTTTPKKKARKEDDEMKRNICEVGATTNDVKSAGQKRKIVLDGIAAPERLLQDPISNASVACASDPSPRLSGPALLSPLLSTEKGRPAGVRNAPDGRNRGSTAPDIVPKHVQLKPPAGVEKPRRRGTFPLEATLASAKKPGDGFDKPTRTRRDCSYHSEPAHPRLGRQRSSGWGPPGFDLLDLNDLPPDEGFIDRTQSARGGTLEFRDPRVNMTPRTRRRSLHIARWHSTGGKPNKACMSLGMDSNDPTSIKTNYNLKRADSDKVPTAGPHGEEHTITVSSPTSVRLRSSLSWESSPTSPQSSPMKGEEDSGDESKHPKYNAALSFMRPDNERNPYLTPGRTSTVTVHLAKPVLPLTKWSSIPRQVTPIIQFEPNEEHGVGFTNELIEEHVEMPSAPQPPLRLRSGSCGSDSEGTMYTKTTKATLRGLTMHKSGMSYMDLTEEADAYAKADPGLREYIDNVVFLLLIRRKHRRVRIKQMPLAFMIADLISKYSLDVQVERVCEIEDASCMCIGNDRCLYVADDSTQIYRMDPNQAAQGKLIQWAGTGEWGCDNRGLSDSSFNLIRQMFADKDSTLTVVDYGNHCVREVNPRQGDEGAVRILIGVSPSGQRMPGGVRDQYMDGDETVARFKWPKGMCNVDKRGTLFLCADDNRLRLLKREEDGTYNLETVLKYERDVEAVLYLTNPPCVFFTSLDTEMEQVHVHSIPWNPEENCIPDGATAQCIATVEDSGSCTHRNLIWDPHSQSLLLNCDSRIVKLRERTHRRENEAAWEHYALDVDFRDEDGEEDDADTSSFIVYDPHQDLFYFTTNTALYKLFFR